MQKFICVSKVIPRLVYVYCLIPERSLYYIKTNFSVHKIKGMDGWGRVCVILILKKQENALC